MISLVSAVAVATFLMASSAVPVADGGSESIDAGPSAKMEAGTLAPVADGGSSPADAGPAEKPDAGPPVVPPGSSWTLFGPLGGPDARCDQEKTIFIDLGNEPLLGDTDGGAGFGGTSNAGGWVIRDGCGNPTSITSQDSVRVLLLDPRRGWKYSLLHQSGNEDPGHKIHEIHGGSQGPWLGSSPAPSLTNPLPIVQALKNVNALSEKLATLSERCCGLQDGGCDTSPCCEVADGGSPDAACLGDVVARIGACHNEGWPVTNPDAGGGEPDGGLGCSPEDLASQLKGVRGDHNGLHDAASSVLDSVQHLLPLRDRECRAIESRMEAWEKKLPVDPVHLKNFSLGLRSWAVKTIAGLTHYRTTDEFLRTIHESEREVYNDIDTENEGIAMARVIDIFLFVHRWREEGCIPALGHDALEWTRGGSADMINTLYVMEDAAKHVDKALTMLRAVEQAQVFSIGPAEGNTDVLVTIKEKPADPDNKDPAVQPPDPYQISYHVTDTSWLSVSVGYAVGLYHTYPGADYKVVYQGEPTSIFIGGHLCRAESDPAWPKQPFWTRSWCQWLGPMVGLPISDFLSPLGGGGPGNNPLQIFIGGEFWPMPLISLGAGVAGYWQNGPPPGIGLQSPNGTHEPFGLFGAVNIDLPTLVDIIQGVKKQLPH